MNKIRIARITILLIVLMGILFPFLWIITTSFKQTKDIMVSELLFKPTFKHYSSIFFEKGSAFPRYFLNSLITAVSSTFLSIVIGLLAAYSLSRFQFPGNIGKYILGFLLFIRMIFPIALAIPFYYIINLLNLYDTLLALIGAHMAMNIPFAIWMLKSFLDDFPESIEDAARVDGCSRPGALLRVVIPLIAPGIAATVIFLFILSWNDYLFAATLTSTPNATTLPIGLAKFIQENIVLWGNMSAGATIFTIPVFIFALIVQEHLIKGFTLGSFKG